MNENIEWLTVLAVEKQTNIPNATIRRYIRKHGHHLNIRKKGKSYFIASESIAIVLNIRKQYDDGKSQEQVEEALIQRGNPVTITVTAEDKQVTVNVSETLLDMKKAMHEQNTIIQSLAEQMQKQQEYISTKLEERDRALMAAIRENQESKKQIAVADLKKEKTISTQDKQWYQFWK
jgi:ABC-type nitrate/sulfonate/bicarbonate transport system substrate-binding protein